MTRAAAAGRSKLNATDIHRAWLALVDTEGPSLAIPPLKRVWPQGMPRLADVRKAALVDARKDFESMWERLDRFRDSEEVLESYREARDQWVEIILRDVAGWAESLSWGEVPGIEARSPNHAVTVRAQAALNGADGIGALVHVIDPTDSLRQVPGDLWAANPIDRVEAMLRESKVPIGIVTDGRWWGLVCARPGAMAASSIVDALTWIEEPGGRDAFLALIGRQHLIGGEPSERLPVLFEESVAAAEEVTEALGAQVRRAVELLIQSFAESAADARRRGLADPLPERTHDSYEAAVTVMMRTVFLLFAEERGLLPSGAFFEQGYGIARELDRLTAREIDESEEALDSTSQVWHRLLATSRALYQGVSFEGLRMPPYGGSLFDPERFPFLSDLNEQGTLAIAVSDRVMLHVLRSVQVATIKGEARRISFRDIDVEQIGYIYEGLLGYTAGKAEGVTLGLKGTLGEEPEISLDALERLKAEHPEPRQLAAAIRETVKADQPSAKSSSVATIVRGLDTESEPSAVSALMQAVGDDAELRDRVKPWLGVIRSDLRKRPFVVLGDGLLVRETASRKNAGAHYTPKSLAEDVVLHALQPLCYSPGPHQTANEAEWKLRSSHELLDLKIADIACGSGAFLVAAGRYLAERLVEAWTAEDPSNVARRGLYVRAIRQVVANCLYGADINGMAVEMCKLSLWLVSLDRDLPFSFVDDKVFHGNSLLGLTTLDQIRGLRMDPPDATQGQLALALFDVDIDGLVQRAVDIRRRLLSEVDNSDPARTSTAKQRLNDELERVLRDLHLISDGVVAAGLEHGGKPGKGLERSYSQLRGAVRKAYPADGDPDRKDLDGIIASGLTPSVVTDYAMWKPLHWVLEAPDVMLDDGGFDAIVGNPPFLGGQKLTGAMGTNVRDWFVNVVAGGTRGSADLVAYFFLRATSLLQGTGTLGLIATNTVAQGDSREVGLDAMVAGGFTITRAIQSRSWPAASANLEYAAVWGTTGTVSDDASKVADDVSVRQISTLLEPAGRVDGHPVRLAENAGIAFQGCIVLGMGFVLEESEAQEWIAADPRNAEVLFPYLNGEDLNSRPDSSASRWVIDFNDRSEEEAATYPLPYARILERVKPERAQNKIKFRRETWWQFAARAGGLRHAIEPLSEVLVIALVSKSLIPIKMRSGQVFSHKLGVFATDSYSDLAVLSSSLHQMWVVKYTSTMRTDINYSPSDVFLTFPRPPRSPDLDKVGRRLSDRRQRIMERRNLGVTKLYNMVHDSSVVGESDIDELRRLHANLDAAVASAFGWSDLELKHGFHEYRKVTRWTIDSAGRIEVLDRLLEENRHRAGSASRSVSP